MNIFVFVCTLKVQCHEIFDLLLLAVKFSTWAPYEQSKIVSQVFQFVAYYITKFAICMSKTMLTNNFSLRFKFSKYCNWISEHTQALISLGCSFKVSECTRMIFYVHVVNHYCILALIRVVNQYADTQFSNRIKLIFFITFVISLILFENKIIY